MTRYANQVSKKTTAQTDKAASNQEKNNAGGYAFVLTKWEQLDRFLILGAEGNTYYCTEKKMVKKATANLEACLNEDGIRTVNRIVEISLAGRAPKNDPAIFALAVAAAHSNLDVRKAALAALPKVCRTGTFLFQFVADVKEFRGFGNSLRHGIRAWYEDKTADKLAYQVIKYQQRNGWSHKDMLRLAHPVAKDESQETVLRYISSGNMDLGNRTTARRQDKGIKREYKAIDASKIPALIEGFEKVKNEKDPKVVTQLILDYGLTHEMIPTEAKNYVGVWEALLENMPMTAMIRNLGKMANVGLTKPLSASSKKVVARLLDKEAIKRARVHPLAILVALNIYKQGKGDKGSLAWVPDQAIVNALDEAFYLAFDAIAPTGKNLLLGIDISGSMDLGQIAGMPGITPRIAAAAMAMATVRSEKNWHVVGFTSGAPGEFVVGGAKSRHYGYKAALTPIDLSPKMRMDAVIKKMQGLPMGGTDCALPMLYATQKGLDVDGFHVYTDNETWAGDIHPHQALKQYRQKANKPEAKLIVAGFTATEFTIADPSDAGMLDVVGFDTAAPAIMADFVRGSSSEKVQEDD